MNDATDQLEPITEEQALDSLLAPEGGVEDETPEDESEEDSLEDAEEAESEEDADEVDTEDGEEEDTAEEEDEDGAEDDEEDEEDAEAEEEPAEKLHDVKVNGQTQQVTLEELKRAYSGQEYIQQGMKQVAEEKKLVTETFQALQQQRAQLAQLNQSMSQTGVLPAPTPPDHNLAATDPIGYTADLAKYNADLEAYTAQQQQLQTVTQQQEATERAAMQAHAEEQRKILDREIPDFSDAEKGKEIRKALRETGERYGFSAEELSSIVDARTIKVLHDAMQFQKIKSAKPVVEAKAKKARPKAKPKATRKTTKQVKQMQDARKRLRDTGSPDAAMELLFQGNG